jgi:ABC-type cobalamin/Fe3+-siderophores transport systems, ATPase components
MNFLRPQTGEIYINNEPLINKTPAQMASLIAYTPQNSGTYFDFSAFEVVLSGRARFMRGLKFSKTDHKIAQMALINVGAYELKNKAITALSGGERQLVFIARSLAQQTPMMILDEPTSALDFKNQIAFWEILRSVCVSEDDFNASNLDLNLKSDLLNFIGKTAIVCTHDPNHAFWFCDEILALKNGEIIAYGDAKSALNEQNLFEIYGRECKITDGKIQFIAPYPILSRF